MEDEHCDEAEPSSHRFWCLPGQMEWHLVDISKQFERYQEIGHPLSENR